ncbi:ribbon-helix-helix protein, CopG family [Paracoccus jeotgali]|uniref:ribbon-helix-helix protein, CopG family n=1 Tax=Paracoccus jeotgali TaxID=2065379 RepID=UPI0028B00ACB|nr:ribbon-helix-helix protein, CopG family [Paracoccus jeotgali]
MPRPRGRPKADTVSINLRLPRSMIEEIDSIRLDQKDLPTRPEMIRRALAQWLEMSERPGRRSS